MIEILNVRRVMVALFLACTAIIPNWWIYRFEASGLISGLPTDFCYTYLGLAETCSAVANAPIIFLVFSVLFLFLLRAGQLPRIYDCFFADASKPIQLRWSILVIIGAFALATPAILVGRVSHDYATLLTLSSWTIALISICAGFGLVFAHWRSIISISGQLFLLLFLSTSLTQLASYSSELLWSQNSFTLLTFHAVALVASLLGQAVTIDQSIYQITVGSFSAEVASSCSGISGVFLSIASVICFSLLMRSQLLMLRVMAFIPVVALLSWSLNIIRIVLLMLIGAHYSPELAVEGFHSYAGWLMFILLSVTMFVVLDRATIFQKIGHSAANNNSAYFIPSRSDKLSALMLPFIIFVFTALAVQALADTPEALYPLRVVVLALALLYFLPALPKPEFSSIGIAVTVGVLVSAAWLASAHSAAPLKAETVAMGSALGWELLWITFRLLGTILLVPIAEELFFRKYVLERINHLAGKNSILPGIALSSAIFAALHANFILAFIVGISFALVYLRRRLIWDAIIAHSTANAVIAIFAVYWNDYSVI